MRRILIILAVLMMMLAAVGAAEVKTYTYGGSKRDWLTDIAVSDNGYIALTGWTESSDGTLANRTKKGRSGWLLIIDSEGNEIVNFCTRLGEHDDLGWPVFHEDGTLTTMLFAEDADVGWVKLELLRLDMSGKVVSRKVIMEKRENEEHFINVVGRDERGYIVQERLIQAEGGYTYYDLFDFEGNHVRRLDEWNGMYAVADAHSIHLDEPGGKDMGLYALDGQGSEKRLSKAFELREDDLRPVMYDGFISLPDGGAAGAGWVLQKDAEKEERIGLFTRWDVQGNIVSEMRTPGVGYGELTLRPGGFAATAYPWDEKWANDSVWTLYLLDANGVLEQRIAIAENAVGTGHNACVGSLGDGTVVTAHVTAENGGDTVVTIVSP